jgi:hypothetical protein
MILFFAMQLQKKDSKSSDPMPIFRKLPPQAQQEVLDFMGYLLSKPHQDQHLPEKKIPFLKLMQTSPLFGLPLTLHRSKDRGRKVAF